MAIQTNLSSFEFTFSYFSEDPKANKLLATFEKNLSSQDLTSIMKSPELGCSGFTFLCEMSSHTVQQLKSNEKAVPLKFVLKWINPECAENEKMGADLCAQCGFNAPKILIIGKSIANKLGRHALKQKHSMTHYESLTLLAMPRFHAITFNAGIKNGKLFQLSSTEWEQIAIAFGKISIFDLVIGNDDRLVKLDFSHSTFLNADSQMNDGNAMLEICESEHQLTLKNIYFIDNASSNTLYQTYKTTASEAFAEDFLFSDMYETSQANLPETDLDSEGPKEVQEEKIGIERFHKAFVFLTSNTTLLAHHICVNVHRAVEAAAPNEIKKDNTPSAFYSVFEKSVEKGILQGIEEVAKLQIDEIKSDSSFNRQILELARLNLTSIRKH